jgi:uncharacterized Zn finger protein
MTVECPKCGDLNIKFMRGGGYLLVQCAKCGAISPVKPDNRDITKTKEIQDHHGFPQKVLVRESGRVSGNKRLETDNKGFRKKSKNYDPGDF